MGLTKTIKQLNHKEFRLLVLICFLSLCALIAWLLFSANGILTYRDLKKQLADVQLINEDLEEENRLLREKIDKIVNDPNYLEEVSRDEFNLLKKDEVVFEFK